MEIIPFGKYKGQPVEVLTADPQYAQWMISQGDFINRFPNIKAFIINNFQEPSETPEHNKFQAMFTDNEYVDNFMCYCEVNNITDPSALFDGDYYVSYEKYSFDVVLQYGRNEPDRFLIEIKPSLGDDYPSVLRQIESKKNHTVYRDGRPYTAALHGRRILLIDEYTGVGATLEQIKNIFIKSGIHIVILSAI